jgi:hypothetical protein
MELLVQLGRRLARRVVGFGGSDQLLEQDH